MLIQNGPNATPVLNRNAVAPATPKAPEANAQVDTFTSSAKNFYNEFKTPLHVAGGALLGAGIASIGGGATGQAVMSAAGTGALVGWVLDSPKSAFATGGGAIIGATIATLAGVPGAGVISAAGTGALIGWVIS